MTDSRTPLCDDEVHHVGKGDFARTDVCAVKSPPTAGRTIIQSKLVSRKSSSWRSPVLVHPLLQHPLDECVVKKAAMGAAVAHSKGADANQAADGRSYMARIR